MLLWDQKLIIQKPNIDRLGVKHYLSLKIYYYIIVKLKITYSKTKYR